MVTVMQMSIEIDKAAFAQIDQALAQIETNLRGNAVAGGMRAVGRVVANGTKALLPKPGYERFTRPKGLPYSDKSEPKPLGQTVKTKVLRAAGGVVITAIIGYEWPAGAHGHLVEMGHDLVKGGKKKSGGTVIGHVKPAEYMITTVNASRSQFDSIIITAAKKLIKV